MADDFIYALHDRVIKPSGDYTFTGVVVGLIRKRSGARRYVVEDDRGLLFIFSDTQLQRYEDYIATQERAEDDGGDDERSEFYDDEDDAL